MLKGKYLFNPLIQAGLSKGEAMKEQILITGGAGFIGSHLANELLDRGYRVRALDNLSPQVHGPDRKRPEYLDPEVELLVGDVRDPDMVRRALRGVDAVFHLVAAVGVGQSMYQIADYTSVNNGGTAVLLEALIENPVARLVVASSMSIYGEGLYRRPDGALTTAAERTLERLKRGDWEPRGSNGETLTPVPTPEWKEPCLASVYALSKYDQERMCLMVGRAYKIPAAAVRFFNVYGPNQALSNPYTGVLAIFATRLLNGKAPVIYEDGKQRRDFVSVYDVARACRLAMENPQAEGRVFNIGSGRNYTIRTIARKIAKALGKEHLRPEITGKYRVGDIRHCFADMTAASDVLGFRPKISLDKGLVDLAAWLGKQVAFDRVAEARAELTARGLMV
jgi:dTDP-L-rhamnose 4-epimerase